MKMPDGLGVYHAEVTEIYDHMVTSSAAAEDDQAITAHPHYLDKGAECYAYRLRDQQRIVKIPLVGWMDYPEREFDPLTNEYMVEAALYLFDIRLAALDRAVGVRRLEQMRAYTTSDTPSVVVDYIPAIPAKTMPSQPYALHDYHTLFDAFDEIEARNLAVDPVGDNYLYAPDSGYHIVDCMLRSSSTPPLEKTIAAFALSHLHPRQVPPQNIRRYQRACREHYGKATADALKHRLYQKAHEEPMHGQSEEVPYGL